MMENLQRYGIYLQRYTPHLSSATVSIARTGAVLEIQELPKGVRGSAVMEVLVG